jgi:putative transposase
MPWSGSHMEDRSKFIEEWRSNTWSVADLCRRFQISRKTAYKTIERFKAQGPSGLGDRSRARRTQPHRTSEKVEQAIVELAQQWRIWGPRKLRRLLMRRRPATRWPATSTMFDILKRHGLTKPRRCNRSVITPGLVRGFEVSKSNDLWRTDFKGWKLSGDKKRCEPLAITDHVSRFGIACSLVSSIRFAEVWKVFERSFKEYGLPRAILSDNGPPFAHIAALAGMTRLSVMWLRLGIRPIRIDPGRPQQNGGHERFNLTLQHEAMTPMAKTKQLQARRTEEFRRIYNEIRPHEALGDRTPSEVFASSPRRYPEEIPEFQYEARFMPRFVTKKGYVRLDSAPLFLSEALVGQTVGCEYIGSMQWAIHLGPLEVALIDEAKNEILRYDEPIWTDVDEDCEDEATSASSSS